MPQHALEGTRVNCTAAQSRCRPHHWQRTGKSAAARSNPYALRAVSVGLDMSSSRLQVGCQICQMLAIFHRKRAAPCSRLGGSSRVDSELPRALADLCDHRIGIVGGTQPCHWQGGCPQRTSAQSFPSPSFRLLGPGPGSVGSLIPSESSLRLAPLHAEAAQYWAYVPYHAGLEFTLAGILLSATGRSRVGACHWQCGPGGKLKVGGACVSRVAQLEPQDAHLSARTGRLIRRHGAAAPSLSPCR